MFTESSGSMYEEIENQRKQLLRKRKIMKRRILVIISLGLFVLYLGLLLNDIRRFHKGDKPLITISYKVKEYDDGKVETYTSLGWIFRYYLRETINQNEIAPIWSPIKKDKELNRQVFDENLPEIETNYTVPDNMGKKEKDKGVLFFYDKDENLLGTYKCALSENDCEISYSGVQDEDKNVRPYNVKMSIFENRYVFITEYKNRYSTAQEKYVFLYDITAKHLIAGYQDVRYATYDTDDKNINHGYVDENRFIVMKNDKWGIDQVEKGRVSHFEEYQYYYINYDEETKLYIFETPKDNWGVNKWVAFDANKKFYTKPVSETIESFYYKNDRIYILAYTKPQQFSTKKNYLLYNQEGENVLAKNNIDDLKAYDKFLVYTNDQYLYIIDYDGKELVSSIKLNFVQTQTKVKNYIIKIIGNTLVISTPKEQSKTHFTDEYYFDMNDWSLTKTRQDVKETF